MSHPTKVRVLHGTLMSLKVEINGRVTNAMLDVAQPAILVNAPIIAELELEENDEATLRIGMTAQEDIPVRLSDHPLFNGWDPQGNGFLVVGAPAVMNCALSLSWVHQEIRTCRK